MTTVHHLKITLKHLKPLIWREVLVPSDIRLDRLHQVIQIAMGWEDCHLHEFSAGKRGPTELRFGSRKAQVDLGSGFGDAPPLRDECKATLLDLAPVKGSKFVYWYDFGDDWLHDVVVKAVGQPAAGLPVPGCARAAGGCPPEDCGGPPGYCRMLEILADPRHEEFEEMLDWIGEDWQPEHYDIAAVNAELARLAAGWTKQAGKPPRPAKR